MQQVFRVALIGLAVASVTACAGTEYGSVKSMTPAATATAFDQALFNEYVALAKLEYEEADYADSDVFAARARAAAEGKKFGPEEMTARTLPEDKVAELRDARGRLVRALSAGAGEKAPKGAARAQAGFDCWMQEQQENFQPADIAACKKQFLAGMDEVDTAMQAKPMAAAPAPAPKPAPAALPGPFAIFFDFDQATLNDSANDAVKQAVAAITAAKPDYIVVAGHTDRAGETEYNRGLSMQRAEAVAKAIGNAQAIAPARIVVRALGETAPRIATPDGQREPANRRAMVELMRK